MRRFSIPSVSGDTVLEVFLELSSVHVLFVLSVLEKAGEGVLPEGVVRVHGKLSFDTLRGLDVPENVIWNCVKNLFSFSLGKRSLESFFKILNIAVLFSKLED